MGLYTYRERYMLKIYYRFFKMADTNHSGLLTCSECWRGIVRWYSAKGYSYATIRRYYAHFKRWFNNMDTNHTGLVTWYEMKRWVIRNTEPLQTCESTTQHERFCLIFNS